MNDIFYVGGVKGGVGKTLVTLALIDWLQHRQGVSPLLIEGDPGNPDAAAALTDDLPGAVVPRRLDTEPGWEAFAQTIHEARRPVVVNSAAANVAYVTTHGALLRAYLDHFRAAGRRFWLLWLLNRDEWTLRPLAGFLEALGPDRIVVLKNQRFGTDFTLWEGSAIRKSVLAQGGREGVVPDLHDVYDSLKAGRLSFARGCTEFAFGKRVRLERHRETFWTLFAEVLQ